MRATAKIKKAFQLIWLDIKALWLFVVCVAIYICIANFVFETMCPFAIVTGLPCPGCGLTRAAFCVLRLDFAGAFEMHAFIYPCIVIAVICFINRYFLEKKNFMPMGLIITVGCIMIIYWIWRLFTIFPGPEPMNYRERNVLGIVRELISNLNNKK